MLSVTISIPRGEATPESTPPYVHETERNGVRVRATVKPQYSFYAEFGDIIVVGESLVPMGSARLARIERIVSGSFSCESSGDDFLLSLVVIDTLRKEVTLSNAVMSMRPYFFHVSPNCISVASTFSDLRSADVPMSVDESKLPEFYLYRFVSPPYTLVKGVHKLVGGQTVSFNVQSGARTRDDFSQSMHRTSSEVHDPSFYLERTEKALSAVIHNTLQSYKRPMVLLSGGTDSSLLATMALKLDSRVKSCSTSFSFADKEDMEESYALSFADQIGIRHTIYRPTAEEYLAGVVESIAAAEEPLHHLQSVLLFLLSKNFGNGEADVLFNGLFSDGLFGDEVHHAYWKHRHAIAFLKATWLAAPLRRAYRLSGLKSRRLHFLTNDFRQVPSSSRHLLHGIGQYGDITLIKQLFGGSDETIFASRMSILSKYENYSILDKLTVINGLILSSYTGGLWGRLAEVSGNVEAFPFAAKSVIDSVVDTPWPIRMVEPKRFVRELLRKYGIPDSLITRPKKSFGFPYQYWSLPHTLFQPLVDMAADTYDRALLSRLQTGEPRHAMILWNMINFHLWKQIVIDQKNSKDLATEAISRYRTLPRPR
ncbi:MAG: asparagine synthase C-terminal domain-containing protein [Candidatus Zixiibacteriota bacterium]